MKLFTGTLNSKPKANRINFTQNFIINDPLIS